MLATTDSCFGLVRPRQRGIATTMAQERFRGKQSQVKEWHKSESEEGRMKTETAVRCRAKSLNKL